VAATERPMTISAFHAASPTPAIVAKISRTAPCPRVGGGIAASPFICSLGGLPTTPCSDQNQRMPSGPPPGSIGLDY
jgi:hypothetical protein